jgi:hypothetical protein
VRERVQRDVQPPQPGLDERLGQTVEQDAVRRQREVRHPGRVAQHPHQHRQVAAHERLATGQPHLLDAHRGEHTHDPRGFLEAEHLVAREPLQPLRRHAVAAAEVALVGDGDADALDLAAPGIQQRLHEISLADVSRGETGGTLRARAGEEVSHERFLRGTGER